MFTIVFRMDFKDFSITNVAIYKEHYDASLKYSDCVELYGYQLEGLISWQGVMFENDTIIAANSPKGIIWSDDICCFPVNAY